MFDRLIKLIGEEKFNIIQSKIVCVVGLGGVGGICTETLIRNGIKNIIIIDNDVVDISNKNRQIIALDSTIGKDKTEVLKNRLLDINKEVNIKDLKINLSDDTKEKLFNYKIDYIIDACDTVNTKIMLIKECKERNIKLLTITGTGKKLDPSKIEITDLSKTSYDPLSRVLRRKVKDLGINTKVTVLTSREEVKNTSKDVIASYSPVTNIAGIFAADYVLKEIMEEI